MTTKKEVAKKETVKKETVKTETETVKTETVSIPNLLNIKPKVQTYTALEYKGFGSLADLVNFIGQSPTINADQSLKVGKHKITENSVVVCHGQKIIEVVSSLSEIEKRFSILKETEK